MSFKQVRDSIFHFSRTFETWLVMYLHNLLELMKAGLLSGLKSLQYVIFECVIISKTVHTYTYI